MEALVEYLVKPLAAHPADVQITAVEGSASVLLELRVNVEDVDAVRGEDGSRIHAIQQILSASGGKRKPVLELIDSASADSDGAEE